LIFKISEPGLDHLDSAEAKKNDPYYNVIKPEHELTIRDLNMNREIFTGIEKNVFRVDAEGSIILPLIGEVSVGGLNRQQASEKIRRAYEEKELRAPLIDLQISNMQVVILGEVSKQGTYPLNRENYELIDLLGDAQGFSANANTAKIKIFRGERRKPEAIHVNMRDYSFMSSPRLLLRSGDIVYVEPKISALKIKKAQEYSSFVQLGLVLISTLLIVINR